MKQNITRLTAFLLSLVMLFSVAVFPVSAASSYDDVAVDAWYAEAVEYVSEKGIMDGVADGVFNPNGQVTRAMFVTVLYRLAKATAVSDVNKFADVPTGEWYSKAVAWAAEKGIVNGVSDTRFAPNRSISRQDMCTILARFVNVMEYELAKPYTSNFSDAVAIAKYARDAVADCAAAGLVDGFDDGTFKPRGTATRAQIAMVMMRVDLALDGQILEPTPMPAQSFAGNADVDMTVSVEAPEGALPEGTVMELERVSGSEQLTALAAQINCDVLAATNITFKKDGAEIEPEEEVEVKISVVGLDGLRNPAVVHIKADGSYEHVDSELISNSRAVSDKSIRFYAKDFSVYAVIDDPTAARLKVNFYKGPKTAAAEGEDYVAENDPNWLATVYVKEGDTLLGDGERIEGKQYIEDIVYDPGVGTLGQFELFDGWSHNDTYGLNEATLNIDAIRQEIANKNITQDDEIDYYAVIYKYFNISYYDADGLCYGMFTQKLLRNQETADYTVNMAFTPGAEQNFEGWRVKEGVGYIKSAKYANGTTIPYPQGATQYDATSIFPNDSVVTISGSVQFTVDVTDGHWLVFHENPDGNHKGTYIAPQFLEQNEETKDPNAGEEGIEMHCAGYTFDGWYYATSVDDDGHVTAWGSKFVFGGTLSQNTHLYAKWTDVTTANYTVIIWKENLSGTGWNYYTSYSPSGNVDAVITYTDQYANNADFVGFEFKEYDEGKTIERDNSTVVNVYYQRKTYTLTFKTSNSYPIIEYKTISNYELVRVQTGNNSYTYAIKLSGKWYQITSEGIYVWNASQINSVPTPGSGNIGYRYNNRNYTDAPVSGTEYTIPQEGGVVKTITTKYEHFIGDNFPIVGTNGTTYTAGRWQPGTNSLNWSQVMSYIDVMPSDNVTFTLDTETRPLKTIHYYLEDDEGTVDGPATLYSGTSNTVTNAASGKKYKEYKSVDVRFNGVTMEDIASFNGYTIIGADQRGGNQSTSSGNVFFYIWNTNTNSHEEISFYYSRNQYKITYMDGSYFGDKNGDKPMSEVRKTDAFKEETGILFNADISAYGDPTDTTHYYKPNAFVEGYLFAGWYVDQSCTTLATEENMFNEMPVGGITVYAKWIQSRYRVFLHSNVPESDTTLNWGSSDQAMNFGLAYGQKISAPEGTRTGYKFIGWFRDNGTFKKVFNADYIPMNDTNVPAEPVYDKTVDMTDYMNKYGNIVPKGGLKDDGSTVTEEPYNSDADRWFVQRKLDLYAKWSKEVDGAKGIGVRYDANGGSNAPTDNTLYLDNVKASAQGAATPPAVAAGEVELQFLYWVVQTWDSTAGEDGAGAYVDYIDPEKNTKIYVAPGDEFDVLLDLAKQTQNPDHTETNHSYTYTMQLRADYGPVENPAPTHIYWYSNNGTTPMPRMEAENLPVNVGTDIPTQETWVDNRRASDAKLEYENHVFLGWARLENHDGTWKKSDGTVVNDTLTLTADDLFLRWIPETTVNGDTVEGHYEAKKPGTTTWVTVTQVACDENQPYHDLFAVWSSCFYIYHSSDADLEAVQITQVRSGENAPVDLTSYVKDGHLYGGYYSAYGGIDPEAEALSTAKLEAGSRIHVTVEGAEPYTGAYVYSGSTNTPQYKKDDQGKLVFENGAPVLLNTKLWDSSKAAKEGGAENFTYKGTVLTPVQGMVYYLKEVPDTYLHSKTIYVVDNKTGGGVISEMLQFTLLDDTNYSSFGFYTAQSKAISEVIANGTTTVARALNSYTVTSRYDEANSVTVDAGTFDLDHGYVLPLDMSAKIANSASVTMLPTWVTYDGIPVYNDPLNYTFSEDHKSVEFSRDDFLDESKLYIEVQGFWQNGPPTVKAWIWGDNFAGRYVTAVKTSDNNYYIERPSVFYNQFKAEYWSTDGTQFWNNDTGNQTIPAGKNKVYIKGENSTTTCYW